MGRRFGASGRSAHAQGRMSMTTDLLTELAHLAAWFVQAGLSAPREMGIGFPARYDLGMRVLRRTPQNSFAIRIRLDDVSVDGLVHFPDGHESSIGAYKAAIERAQRNLRDLATELAMTYLN